MSNKQPVIIESTATVNSGSFKYPFSVKQKMVYLTNDSSNYDMQVNFDGTIGEVGTFTIKAGESISEVPMIVDTISAQGINGDVPFRVMGV